MHWIKDTLAVIGALALILAALGATGFWVASDVEKRKKQIEEGIRHP